MSELVPDAQLAERAGEVSCKGGNMVQVCIPSLLMKLEANVLLSSRRFVLFPPAGHLAAPFSLLAHAIALIATSDPRHLSGAIRCPVIPCGS